MSRTQRLIRTALLLALTLIWQSLRYIPMVGIAPWSPYVISSLVNATLIVALAVVGLPAAVLLSLTAPVVALMQGHAQIQMVPFIMLGNLALVVGLGCLKGLHRAVAVTVVAVAKYLIIAFGMALMLVSVKGQAWSKGMISAAGLQIQQLVTVFIGALIAMPVVHRLRLGRGEA